MENEFFCVPSPNARHRLILLHGWGADCNALLALGHNLIQGIGRGVDFISMNAPNHLEDGGGRLWYKLFPPDWDEANQARDGLLLRLENLDLSQIPFEKTVMLGFSQGGAMALASGAKLPLAGLVGCSAYPHPEFITPSSTPSILLTHGRNDQIVPLDASKKLFEIFDLNRSDIELSIFVGGHEIPQEAYIKIRNFLEKCFK